MAARMQYFIIAIENELPPQQLIDRVTAMLKELGVKKTTPITTNMYQAAYVTVYTSACGL